MPTHTQEQILEKYKNLPLDVQEAIFSVDTANIIQKISRDNNLNVEKMGILADETGLLMLGITHPNEFIPNLANRLEIDKQTASKIGQEINTQIFAKIRESLKKIHEQGSSVPPAPNDLSRAESREVEGKLEKIDSYKMPRIIKPVRHFKEPEEEALEEEEEELLKKMEKDIVKKRNLDGIHRLKKETTEKAHPFKPTEIKELKKAEPRLPAPRYPGGNDPYREPLK